MELSWNSLSDTLIVTISLITTFLHRVCMDFKRLILFLMETGPLLRLSWKTGTASFGVMVLLLALKLWNESMRVEGKGGSHLKE
jgi:hypothetical protein